jgi:hypothetical protein
MAGRSRDRGSIPVKGKRLNLLSKASTSARDDLSGY